MFQFSSEQNFSFKKLEADLEEEDTFTEPAMQPADPALNLGASDNQFLIPH